MASMDANPMHYSRDTVPANSLLKKSPAGPPEMA
jgi:hypothetical protein